MPNRYYLYLNNGFDLRHSLYILAVATLLSVGCVHAPVSKLDIQKELVSLDVSVRKVSLNPTLLLPFLDEKNAEEAALKTFLRSISEVNIYNLPCRRVLNEIAVRTVNAKYVQRLDLLQGAHHMRVYIYPAKGDCVTALVLLLEESDKFFYGIEMSGHVNGSTLASLSNISPSFLDSYINRFNVKF